MLPKVELGSTGMMVTKLGFGALELRDPEHLRANVSAVEKGPLEPELHEAVRAAVEAVAG